MTINKLFTFDNPCCENTALIGESLPEISFIKYKAFKLKDTEIAWVNKKWMKENEIDIELAKSVILDNYSYVAREYATDDELDLNDFKYFLADRYGNDGDAGNGGSARCGLNGLFQIKGNGVNPLVAVNVDKGHSSGKFPLSEAISEAIWSEICHKELPYGALRVIAIIRTKQTLIGANTFGDLVEQPCALMIREVAIRPAHFEPALNFWPRKGFENLRDSTHIYVEDAVKLLESNEVSKTESKQPLFDLMTNFVIKFATQIAVSRVKGIPHGSLTSSNIALDGRFLDLGTMSGIGDFSNVLLTSGLGATWDDHLGVSQWLQTTCYHLNRNSKTGISEEEKRALLILFEKTLFEKENIYTARECGLSLSNEDMNMKGEIIKESLRDGKRKVSRLKDCEFDTEKFLSDVNKALLKVNSVNSVPNFKYRKAKYSRFTIFSHPCLLGQCGTSEEVDNFVSSYIN